MSGVPPPIYTQRVLLRLLPVAFWLSLIGVIGFGLSWYRSFERVVHDKAANADGMQRLWRQAPNLPIGVVVPSNNRWNQHAFVAERSTRYNDRGGVGILILDDHYTGDDETYSSGNGVIGDDLSAALLCAVPAKAALSGVIIDPIVKSMIATRCGRHL